MFKSGKYYSFQGRRAKGDWVYLYADMAPLNHTEMLRVLARQNGKRFVSATSLGSMTGPAVIHKYHDPSDDDFTHRKVRVSDSPYELPLTSITTKVSDLVDRMRGIRNLCATESIDPTTIRLVVVDCGVEVFKPEPESDDAVVMRKFILEKLSQEEKELLQVTHWDVYHKLGDRSMLPDDDEDGQ